MQDLPVDPLALSGTDQMVDPHPAVFRREMHLAILAALQFLRPVRHRNGTDHDLSAVLARIPLPINDLQSGVLCRQHLFQSGKNAAVPVKLEVLDLDPAFLCLRTKKRTEPVPQNVLYDRIGIS